jgi:putative FmdB family regulatory protein
MGIMPIYEFKCKNCDHDFEVIQGKDEKDPECPECKSTNVARQIPSAFGTAAGCGAPKKSGFS